MFRILMVLAVILQSTFANYNVQPPYQVSVMLEIQPGNLIHHCNGIIVYEKLIVTTAGCVHIKFGSKGRPKRLDASDLSIVAGSTTAFTDALRINLSSIAIHKNFDPDTMANDIAVLTLSQSLPLGTRPDMKWIVLDDNIHVNHSCLANFFSRNSLDDVPNYYQTEELVLFNNEICRNHTRNPSSRKDDICSIYVLPQQFDCAAADSFLSFNNDRGTGLVCKSYLVGLLSSVVTRPNPLNNCSDVELAAMYTNIFPHLMWIYTIMANIDTEYISTPYDAALNSLVINSTNNNKEVLTTTLLPLTTPELIIPANSTTTLNNATVPFPTISNSTTTNSSICNSTITNTTAANHTVMNSTTNYPIPANSTETSISTWNPIPTNLTTTWNSTAINSTAAMNNTTHLTNRDSPTTINYTIAGPPPTRPPAYPSSTDSYNIPYPSQTIRNFFKSNAASSVRTSASSLLIALVSLRLIIYH